MELSQAIIGRRSVRAYTAEAVDESMIRRLIDAAIQAPSAVNQQPWRFTVVRDPARLDRLSSAAKAHLAAADEGAQGADHFKVLLANPDFHIFYHAPVLILISAAAEGPLIVEDCALAAQNLMLAAHAAGLGSCWIGFAKAVLDTAAGKAIVDLPAGWAPVAPIIVGHPRAAPPPAPRRPAEIRWLG